MGAIFIQTTTNMEAFKLIFNDLRKMSKGEIQSPDGSALSTMVQIKNLNCDYDPKETLGSN